jgi:tetratricopeptide (TPR) repeat protein
MDRENFFVLLELSTDPPEDDPEKIEQAVKNLQAKWSRFRNHPTKSIQAKKILGLLPEIRRVMNDPDLRRKEAESAVVRLAAADEEKLAGVDRHLAIHMSKGFVTDEEVAKLAELHGVDQEAVRKRLRRKEEEKFAEIDQQIGIRMTKGYITEDEIAKIAKAHVLPPDLVRKRVTGTIKKEGEASTPVSGKGLDPSLAKVIQASLAVTGHSSLYDFLGVEPNASLKLLQKKAHKKEADLLKIGRKDAVVTASQSLAGHCVSIFKNDETRQAYDVSLARRHLTAFDADIDIAGMDGHIRAEYMGTLLQSALRFGMDEEEALRYIQDYAAQKGWTIEGVAKPKKKPANKKLLAAVAAGIFIVVAGAGIGAFLFLRAQSQAAQFEELTRQAVATPAIEQRIALYQNYVSGPKTKYTPEAVHQLEQLKNLVVTRDLNAALQQAQQLVDADSLHEAVAVFDKFLELHSESRQAASANEQRTQILRQIDQNDFAALEKLAGQDVETRMRAYVRYWTAHPQGLHKEDVNRYILDAAEEYYIAIKKRVDEEADRENWVDALKWVGAYLNIYEGKNPRAVQMVELRDRYSTYLREARFYDGLVQKAQAEGDNHDAAIQVYREFLQAYPGTHVEKKILNAISRLEQEKELARVEAMKNQVRRAIVGVDRFVEQRPGTVFDKITGRTWTMLDSSELTGGCMNFESAKLYVENLDEGGYRDWRLPSPEELNALYKQRPYFPAASEQTFWTSKSFRAHRDGWINVVEVVDNRPDTAQAPETRDSRECHAVHAVR